MGLWRIFSANPGLSNFQRASCIPSPSSAAFSGSPSSPTWWSGGPRCPERPSGSRLRWAGTGPWFVERWFLALSRHGRDQPTGLLSRQKLSREWLEELFWPRWSRNFEIEDLEVHQGKSRTWGNLNFLVSLTIEGFMGPQSWLKINIEDLLTNLSR